MQLYKFKFTFFKYVMYWTNINLSLINPSADSNNTSTNNNSKCK